MRAACILLLLVPLLAGCASPEPSQATGPQEVDPWPSPPDEGVPVGQGVVAAPAWEQPSGGESSGCNAPSVLPTMEPHGDGWAIRVGLQCGWGDEGTLRVVSPDQSLRPPANVSWSARIPEHGPVDGTFLFPVEAVHSERGVAAVAWWQDVRPTDAPATALAELARTDDGWADGRAYELRYRQAVPERNNSQRDVGPWIESVAGENYRSPHRHYADSPDPHDEARLGDLDARLWGDATGRFSVALEGIGLNDEPAATVEVRTPASVAYLGEDEAGTLPDGRPYWPHRFESLGRGEVELRLEASWRNPGEAAQVRCFTFTVEPADAFVFYVTRTHTLRPCG